MPWSCFKGVQTLGPSIVRDKLSKADILQSWKLAPAQEALVRLRYATVLHEETENSIQAEEALSKGVILNYL